MQDEQSLTLPLAKQVFLKSFHLSQGDPAFQRYLFRAVALLRQHWRLAEADRNVLEKLVPNVKALAEKHVRAYLPKIVARHNVAHPLSPVLCPPILSEA